MNIRIIPRTLCFKQPAGTSRGVYKERKVWYLDLTYEAEGRIARGLGECAPLPNLSCDYNGDYKATLRRICREVAEAGRLDTEALRPYPSILFGLEMAFRSAKASLTGHYLQLYDTPFTRGAEGIPINGLVWMGSHDEMMERMKAKLREGFHCVKLKIGAIDFESELNLIRRLRARFSPETVELRVDANGGFSVDEAPRRLEKLSRYHIHSIEQPIRQNQWEEMAALCRNTPLPITLDEELIGNNDRVMRQRLLDEIRPQYIVLKPSLHGGFSGCEEWMMEADKRGVGYWVTSALESNVGLNALAQWVSQLPPMPVRHQGLGTGQLFTNNFEATTLQIRGERLWMEDFGTKAFRKQVDEFRGEWESKTPTLTVKTSGSTGQPKLLCVEKERMRHSADMTCRFLGLKEGDTALLCMPLDYIAGKMVCVRAFTHGLRLVVVKPSAHPFETLTTAPTFAAMTPMQVFETLKVPRERALLREVGQLIIGGGSISGALAEALRDFPHPVWSTYGMTETLSHVALRRLNGPAVDERYKPFDGVKLSLTADGCLRIEAPAVCPTPLETNDRAELFPDGTFRILGRKDNVICSGGIKLQTEEIERRLAALGVPFQITAVPDEKYGEAVTLLYVGEADEAALARYCREHLGRYECPRHYVRVERLPLTATGKPVRAEARALAASALGKKV